MAKETLQAVSQAEQTAQESIQQAKEESARLRREAAIKGEELLAAAEKEAKKRAEILYGVARADGGKRKAAIQQETRQEQQELQDKAKAWYALAAREMERIVLGHPRRR